MHRGTMGLVVLTALAACRGDQDVPLDRSDTRYDPHPEVPAILRDVAMIDDDVAFTHPYVPGHRTTMDGRVALRVQGGPPGTPDLAENLSFFLFVPEQLQEPILAGPAGAVVLAEPEPVDVVFPPALDPSVTRLGHHAICDPTTEFASPGERPNPYPCGPDTRNDCYDLVVISSTSDENLRVQMWGTPVTVEVSQPKTAAARIEAVTLGEPVAGGTINTSTEFTEPAVTSDGRLLTGRLGRFLRSWTHPDTGEVFVRPYDLAYSQLPDDAAPCDVTGWTSFHPMSHAPYDARMVASYGLAAYPFRDTEGNPIPDGEDLGGTYPWVDREGANVFMTGVHGRIAEQSETKWPRRCVHPGCEAYEEEIDWDRGFLVGGLWTHGKFVHLDGLINNIDWAVGVTPASHWEVDLYKDAAGAMVPVRFGSGRFAGSERDDGGPYPAGYTHNANILDSLQNLPNHHPVARPITPRDVVWVMSSGVATDEIAFDDLLDPNALIVANMQASITQLWVEGKSIAVPQHHNGQVRELEGIPGIAPVVTLDPEAHDDIHLQNAATSLRWKVPAFGRVEAGTARVEPVALGGVTGRGFWLSGDTAVTWDLPQQAGGDDVFDAWVGLYVDPRAATGEARSLLTFPDGTELVLEGADAVLYVVDGIVEHRVVLPTGSGWRHLGLRVRDGHREVTLAVDGFALDRYRAERPLFRLGAGELVVGRSAGAWTGFRGWIDDLLVLAHDVDVEVGCNHAGGTLVAVEGSSTWQAVAAGRPDWAHAEVADAAGLSGGRFACVTDLSDDHAQHLQNLPAGTRGVRADIHFPEGPLRAGAPRPDSSRNAFCLSCHTAEGKGGLSLAALAHDPAVVAEHDRRRQPSQPPRRVFGNIPAGWIPPGPGPGGPPTALQAPPEGLLVDTWVLAGDQGAP